VGGVIKLDFQEDAPEHASTAFACPSIPLMRFSTYNGSIGTAGLRDRLKSDWQ